MYHSENLVGLPLNLGRANNNSCLLSVDYREATRAACRSALVAEVAREPWESQAAKGGEWKVAEGRWAGNCNTMDQSPQGTTGGTLEQGMGTTEASMRTSGESKKSGEVEGGGMTWEGSHSRGQ